MHRRVSEKMSILTAFIFFSLLCIFFALVFGDLNFVTTFAPDLDETVDLSTAEFKLNEYQP